MLCAERMQRIVQAIILGLILGLAGMQIFKIAFLIMVAMMSMLFIAGVTGFCPGLLLLKQFFPSCEQNKGK
ncbi:MAG: DUF2892 domain-containing protein [Sulfurovum sp.]|nr:DUF2892 domain-containing protein [Sulfurovum sp.]MCB4745068.1 DUF2892 domain-containing protein [Sulfurovum sp.]MCB4745851.1 DUF2892 domain-containing protein [Sulfurovum sp.]MCB4746974.1 DUF2892 domain-containing protein [Sulfurovum sp.]MCB4748855.1 DUF2892 domain-containing protein [Sulfurovum sp.]